MLIISRAAQLPGLSNRRPKSSALPWLDLVRDFSRTVICNAKRIYAKRLTKAEIETIVRLRRQEGKTCAEIAAIIGGDKSKGTINKAYANFCKAKDLTNEVEKKLYLTDAQYDEIVQMRQSGAKWREIGALFGLSERAVSSAHYRRKDPFQYTRRRWTDHDDEYLMHARGSLQLPWDEIAQTLKRSPAALYSRYMGKLSESRSLRMRRTPDWSQTEVEKMVTLRENQKLSWKEVARQLPGRTLASMQYMRRRKGDDGFSIEEVEQLKELRQIRGLPWTEVAKAMPSKSIKSLKRQFRTLSRPANPTADVSAAQRAVTP